MKTFLFFIKLPGVSLRIQQTAAFPVNYLYFLPKINLKFLKLLELQSEKQNVCCTIKQTLNGLHGESGLQII